MTSINLRKWSFKTGLHLDGTQMSEQFSKTFPSPEQVSDFRASGTFDEAWYLSEYPDVAKTGIDPAVHYLWIGRRLGRHPSKQQYNRDNGIGLSWCIIATPHVLFIAHSLAEGLLRHGWSVVITVSMPEEFSHDYYIVMCAQMFERLPPGEKRIIYQLEQSASSRWFSDKYISDMENSFAVLDYSLKNIAFLEGKGIAYPQVYYLPIGASQSYKEAAYLPKDIDILFYGDYKSSPRRQMLLAVADAHFKVVRADTLFGVEMKQLIGRSKLVLNLHYYEGAQLETPRIQECLSLGVPVVSESTEDQGEYQHLDDAVTFFDAGNPEAMLDAIATAQRNANYCESKTGEAVSYWQQRHTFMLDRFLIGTGIVGTEALNKLVVEPVAEGSVYALSLPETVSRREVFDLETRTANIQVFDGIRRRPGWIGCGMSYKYLCQSALASGVKQFTIMEDDALLAPDHSRTMEIVLEYLEVNRGKWDVFSGVIAHLHEETKVHNVETFHGMDFISINKMTSMVFNIYSEKAIRVIAGWDQTYNNPETNTIDRYLEHAGLRVVVTDPYIVGHREELHSTLWGFQNIQYKEMIQQSEQKLRALKNDWRASR